MGWKYEVQAWTTDINGQYRWVQHYAGPSLLNALWVTYSLHHAGNGCVTFTVRG